MVQELRPGHRDKIIVGLTGTFGSGKSTVAHFFEELGAFRVDTDMLAHEALMKGSPVFDKLAALFKEAILPDGSELDRKKIADLVFSDALKRKQLESLVHPYVFERIAEEVGDAEEEVIAVEIPLLFETGFEPFCHVTVAVKVPEDVIERRLQEKGFSKKEIENRKQAQLAMTEKLERSDIIVDNSGTFHETRREVEKAWKKLRAVLKGASEKRWQEKK